MVPLAELPLNLQTSICQYLKDQQKWQTLYELKSVSSKWNACVNSVVWQDYTPALQGVRCKDNDPIYYTLQRRPLLSTDQIPDLNYYLLREGYQYMHKLTLNSDCVAYPWLFELRFRQLYHLVIYPDDHLFEKVETLIKYNDIRKLTILSTTEFSDPTDDYENEEQVESGKGGGGSLGLIDFWGEDIPIRRIFDKLSDNLVYLALKTIVRVPSFYFILVQLPKLQYLEIDHLIIDNFSKIEVKEPKTPSLLSTFALNFLIISQPNVSIDNMPPINTALIPNLTELIHDAPIDESDYKLQDSWCSVLPFINFPFIGQWAKLRKMAQVILNNRVTRTLCNHCPNLEHLELDFRPTSLQEFSRNISAFHILAENLSHIKVLSLGRKCDFEFVLPLDQLFFRPKAANGSNNNNNSGTGGITNNGSQTSISHFTLTNGSAEETGQQLAISNSSSPVTSTVSNPNNPLCFGPSDAFKFSWTNITHLRISLGGRLTPMVFNSLCQFQNLEVLSIQLTTLELIETIRPQTSTPLPSSKSATGSSTATATYTSSDGVSDNADNNSYNNNRNIAVKNGCVDKDKWFPKLKLLKFNIDDDAECTAEDLRNLIMIFPNLAIFEILMTRPIYFIQVEKQFPHIKFKW